MGAGGFGKLTTDGGTVTTHGAWSVHQRPRALRRSDQLLVGWTDHLGNIGITDYNLSTAEATKTYINSLTKADDHSSPALYIRPDDRIVAFWTDRGDSETMFWSISDDPLDISSFGSLNTFSHADNVDYASPVEWSGNLRLYYRVGSISDPKWVYRESSDDGGSFGSAQDVTNFSTTHIYIHPYVDTSGSSDRLHFAMGDHRMDPTGIYHWYLEDGDYYTSDGTLIQSASNPITSVNDVTTVYDGEATGNNPAKQYDLLVHNGKPHVAFTEHVSTGDGGGDGDYRARWARWDGSQWVVGAEITPMGGAMPESHYYEAGLSMDQQDPTTVYVAVETENRNYQIQAWTTDDSGSSWTKLRDVSPAGETITTPTKRGRPISPRDHGGDVSVLWFAGEYRDFVDFKTQIRRDRS